MTFKTYYFRTFDYYDLSGLLTKAENIDDALIRFNRYLETFAYDDIPKLTKTDIQILDKTSVITFI